MTIKMKYCTLFAALALSACTPQRRLDFPNKKKAKDNATMIVLAYPQEVVRTTEALYSNLLPLAGIGIKNFVRGGHACMVLIKDGGKHFEYFDFGRYISPDGYARARGANTDPETKIDVKAVWHNGKIANIKELLSWLYKHPGKTRGYGDLYASVSENVNYEQVKQYVDDIQDEGILKYGPFQHGGSNCARFVADALLNGITDSETLGRVDRLYDFTPSVLGNVDAANSYDYYYIATLDSVYKSDVNLNDTQMDMLFDGGEGYDHVVDSQEGKLIAPSGNIAKEGWQWLGGIGYGVWFDIEQGAKDDLYRITQYCAEGEVVFSDLYATEDEFDLASSYKFDYPSDYERVTLNVNSEKIEFAKIKNR